MAQSFLLSMVFQKFVSISRRIFLEQAAEPEPEDLPVSVLRSSREAVIISWQSRAYS